MNLEISPRTVDVYECVRCGRDHDDLEFHKLARPSDSWTHWATCPNNGEPVLVKVVSRVE